MQEAQKKEQVLKDLLIVVAGDRPELWTNVLNISMNYIVINSSLWYNINENKGE